MVKYLIEKGAITNVSGKSLTQIALEKGYSEIVALLTNESSPTCHATTSQETHETSSYECMICASPSHGIFAFLPCGHALACQACCIKLLSNKEKHATCPLCRKNVKTYRRIYLR